MTEKESFIGCPPLASRTRRRLRKVRPWMWRSHRNSMNDFPWSTQNCRQHFKTFFRCQWCFGTIDIKSLQNRLLKVCYVPATSASLPRVSFFFSFRFLLLQPLTVLMKQTRQAVYAVKQSIFLDVYVWDVVTTREGEGSGQLTTLY